MHMLLHRLAAPAVLLVVTTAAAVNPAAAQDTVAATARIDTIGRRLEAHATRTRSAEEFGRGVVRQALLAVARRTPASRTGTMVINVPVAVRIFTAPGPNEIDVCYEMSTGVQSYLDCTSPVRVIDPTPLPDRCDELSRQFQAATTNIARWLILRDLMALDCVELRRARIALVR